MIYAYCRRNGISLVDAADQLAIERVHLWRIERGYRRPSVELAQRIEAWSDGKIKAVKLLGLEA